MICRPLAITLSISELLLELFNCVLVLFEPQHFILEEDVLLSYSSQFLLVLSNALKKFRLEVIVQCFKVVDLLTGLFVA
jgi:hypothetical protein